MKSFLGSGEVVDTDSDTSGTDEEQDCDTDRDFETIKDQLDFGSFEFTNQGQFIAMYYDTDFYIGQVPSVKTKQEAEVSFMEKCSVKGNVFQWCKSDVDTVTAEFMFDWNFDMNSNNGRM